MGAFYTNLTLRGPSARDLADALTQAGRTAYISPTADNLTVVYDAASEEQDLDKIESLSADLSRRLNCTLLTVLNHDDSVLVYWLYRNGEMLDSYVSAPDYFDPEQEPGPSGGDAEQLCSAFAVTGRATDVRRVLSRTLDDEDAYTFETERHRDLGRLLGLPSFAVGTGYTYIVEGELPEGLESKDLVRLG